MRIAIALLMGILLFAPPALAGDHGDKHGHGEHGRDDDDQGRDEDHRGGYGVDLVFSNGQRDLIRSYQREHYGREHCPPGLAKKHNGCLPPGQAKKRYAVGYPVGPDVEVLDLPGDLSVRIGFPPAGYRYGMIDGDVVKLVTGTLLIVDAVGDLTR